MGWGGVGWARVSLAGAVALAAQHAAPLPSALPSCPACTACLQQKVRIKQPAWNQIVCTAKRPSSLSALHSDPCTTPHNTAIHLPARHSQAAPPPAVPFLHCQPASPCLPPRWATLLFGLPPMQPAQANMAPQPVSLSSSPATQSRWQCPACSRCRCLWGTRPSSP